MAKKQGHHLCQKPFNNGKRLLLRAMLKKTLKGSASVFVPWLPPNVESQHDEHNEYTKDLRDLERTIDVN